MKVWLLAIDKEFSSYEELKYRKVIAQGWSKIGSLAPLLPIKDKDKFKEIVTNYVSYVYEDWIDKRNPGKILLNLISIKEGDYVICCEGENIRGIAKIAKDVIYDYQNPLLYEYAQTICPVTDWKDISDNTHGIKVKSMGPVGIQKYGGDINIEKYFNSLP